MKKFFAFLSLISLFILPGLASSHDGEHPDGIDLTHTISSVEINTSVRASVKATTSEEKQIYQNNQTDLDFVTKNAVQASSTLTESVGVRAVEVRGWDPKQKEAFLADVKERVELTSGQDLENFARGVLIQDENIEQISLNFEKIKVDYKMPAKFLGIIPITLKTTVEATSGERVKVKFPWYSFLFSISNELKAPALEEALEEVSKVDFQSSIQEQARVFQTISNVLKTKHDTVKNSINNIR